MVGGFTGDAAVTEMFEMRCPLTLSFRTEGFAAGWDSTSHSCGSSVAIERGGLPHGFEIGLPSLPETDCKIDVDTRLLFVSSWMVNSAARQRGEDGEMPRPGFLFSALLGRVILDFECVLDGSLARDALDSVRDGPCRDIDRDNPLLLLLGRLSWILARNERGVPICGRNDICLAASMGLALPSS